MQSKTPPAFAAVVRADEPMEIPLFSLRNPTRSWFKVWVITNSRSQWSVPASVEIRTHGSTNRKPAREERTPLDGRSNPPGNATPDNEYRSVLCQRHDRSPATSAPPSNDATRRYGARPVRHSNRNSFCAYLLAVSDRASA